MTIVAPGRAWVILLATFAGGGCGSGRDRPFIPPSDSGVDAPADTSVIIPPPPSMGVSLTIRAARWTASDVLELRLLVGNAADGTPAPLVFSAFTLETDLSAILDARDRLLTSRPGRALRFRKRMRVRRLPARVRAYRRNVPITGLLLHGHEQLQQRQRHRSRRPQ